MSAIWQKRTDILQLSTNYYFAIQMMISEKSRGEKMSKNVCVFAEKQGDWDENLHTPFGKSEWHKSSKNNNMCTIFLFVNISIKFAPSKNYIQTHSNTNNIIIIKKS